MIDLNAYTTGKLTLKDGILFANGKSKVSYPEESNYNYFQLEDDSFWFKHRNNCITTAVKKYTPNKLFLDIGGGNGFVTKGLQASDIETVLLEPGIQGCMNAKKRGIKHIICASAEEVTLKEESIPTIGLFDVVEHIKEDYNFLKRINTLLQQNGHLYLTVPAYSFLWSSEDDYTGHFKRYTLKSISTILKDAGFLITYSTYIFSILPLPIFLSRTLPDKIGRTKKKNELSAYKKEHQKNSKFINAILNKVWYSEVKYIEKGRKIPFGSSCFVIAKKIN